MVLVLFSKPYVLQSKKSHFMCKDENRRKSYETVVSLYARSRSVPKVNSSPETPINSFPEFRFVTEPIPTSDFRAFMKFC